MGAEKGDIAICAGLSSGQGEKREYFGGERRERSRDSRAALYAS